MLRSAWVAFALVALGLCASLVPQVTYSTASSGEPSDEVLVAWPDWAVQQDVGFLSGPVGSFRIWVSAEPDGDVLTMWASLVDAATLDVVRQTSFDVRPGYFPVSRSLRFPEYEIPVGQRLLLQLQVASHEHNYVIYRLSNSQANVSNLMLNGVPNAGSGPMAFVHERSASGLRAAIDGQQFERNRLYLAIVSGVLSVAVHWRSKKVARRAGRALWNLVRPALDRVRRRVALRPIQTSHSKPSAFAQILAIPWYPWAFAPSPILHFLLNNPLHFAASEAIMPVAVSLAVVTGVLVAIWLVFREWHRPAATALVVLTAFFLYGHVEQFLGNRVDGQLFFAIVVVLAVLSVALIARANRLVTRSTQFLNLAAACLLAFPAVGVAIGIAASCRAPEATVPGSYDELSSHLLPEGIPVVDSYKPDVYYIILDRYARHDALGTFDNTDFLSALQSRGFYVAMEAQSNYRDSLHSIPSSLNMSYLSELGDRTPQSQQDLLNVGYANALAAIFKSLGYTYVHLESGYVITEQAPLADVVLTFTPSGPLVRTSKAQPGIVHAGSATLASSERFIRHLLETTMAKPIFGENITVPVDTSPYDWWSAQRAFQTFDVLSKPMHYTSPKFVVSHVVKPHLPATFDQYGNQVASQSFYDSLDDSHDPDVPDAYTGQLIYLNTLVLKAVDGILRDSNGQAIIVLTSDHGLPANGDEREYHTLTAFHLPDGGEASLYPSITSVNHFRVILDYYFNLGIGRVEDRTIEHRSDEYDFTSRRRVS